VRTTMNEEESIFGIEPDRLMRLMRTGLEADESEVENEAGETAPAGGFTEQPGKRIGRYKLLRMLGEGGMGIVYLAEQQGSIRRRVALKVIKPGMDSKRVLARFEAERQALALLDHPNIAHVYDSGTTEAGRPYFVMEYVKGMPITEYCDHYKLTIEQRLRLFQQVCQAVHHAHQKGIIHRDIKPSNILASIHEDQAVPKIIDFGVAKAISQPLTERTLYTEQGQLFGTPEYMSPEQADMVVEDIDTRSDIYSLGVLLYELLTGVLPFDPETFREGGLDNIRKVICETDPKTPSTRLTRLGEEANKVAQNRRTEIGTLAKCLHRELEWIPLKAMRKERVERYRSAFELADDIENYLKGAPLLAGPLTAGYRLRKFMRRNKGVFAAAAVVAAVLVLGVLVSTWQAVRATKAKRAESRLRQQAQANELEMRRIAYASDMSLAQQALAMNDMGRAQQLLKAHRPAPGEVDLRGWEWRYLWQKCRSDTLSELCRYPPSATSVAYSPDGRVLAVAGRGQEFVDIWDVPGRKRIAPLQPKEGMLVAFSPRGDLLATNAGNQIRLWRTGTWDRVDHGQLTLDGDITALKFSPDGTRLASLSLPDELTVWEVNQWAVVRRIRGVRLGAPCFGDLDFSPDGKALVIGDADHHLRVIDLASGNTIFDVSEAHSEAITSVTWSPNGSVIASGSGWKGGSIRLWDADSVKSLGELEGHTSWISDMVFSSDGLLLYSASGDQTIRIWDIGQQRCLATLRGSSLDVLGLALSPDGTTLVSACKDGVVAFWSAVPPPEEEMPRLIPLDRFAQPAFAPDGRILVMSRAGTVSLFDLATSKETEQLPALGADISTVAYSPDGTLLVSGSKSGKIRLWSCAERRLLQDLDGHKESIRLLRFRADGTRLLSLDAEGKAIWWDAPTWQAGQILVGLPVREGNTSRPVDVSPDGRLLVFGTRTGATHWLNGETGEQLATTTGGDRITAQVAFSGDGSQVASTSPYGTVALWDPSSFTLITKLDGHILGAFGVAFSPDGSRLATGGGTSRDAVKLWDLSTQRDLITLPGQSAVSLFVAFSPDGRWLAACSTESNLHLWSAPSWKEIEAKEKRLESGQSP
jgi:WD40 repeat protein/tRNA A-37 threonylcarbamoyl transferase component Bud32